MQLHVWYSLNNKDHMALVYCPVTIITLKRLYIQYTGASC